MHLFVRTATIKRDRGPDALAFATEICAVVNRVSNLEVHAWSVLYGAPITTISWSAMIDSQAAMGEVSEKLQADPGYLSAVADAADLFETAPEDTIAEVLATVNESATVGSYASIVVAQTGAGKIAEAMAWGVDIFNHVGQVTGRPGILSRSLYGPFGTMAWISLADTLEEVDAAGTAMSGDPKYIEMLDQGVPLFLPGSGQARLSQRIA